MRPHHLPSYLSINQQQPKGGQMSEISTGPHHSPGRYEIRLRGHLDSRWAAWFDGLSLTNESDGTTILYGLVAHYAHHRAPITHPSTEGDGHDDHDANHGNETAGETNPDDLNQEDRARRGRLLPDHLRLDPHTRPLRPGEEPPGLDPRLRHPHGRARRRPPRVDRRAGRHRHRRHAVPGG